jgi:hypothetical protein
MLVDGLVLTEIMRLVEGFVLTVGKLLTEGLVLIDGFEGLDDSSCVGNRVGSVLGWVLGS